jgi:hypothetical protein
MAYFVYRSHSTVHCVLVSSALPRGPWPAVCWTSARTLTRWRDPSTGRRGATWQLIGSDYVQARFGEGTMSIRKLFVKNFRSVYRSGHSGGVPVRGRLSGIQHCQQRTSSTLPQVVLPTTLQSPVLVVDPLAVPVEGACHYKERTFSGDAESRWCPYG